MGIQSLHSFIMTVESITQHCFNGLIQNNWICTVPKNPLCVMRGLCVPTTWYKVVVAVAVCLICPIEIIAT
jgi:hypothetical protein